MRHRWITLLEDGTDVFMCLPGAVIMGAVEPDDVCPGCRLKVQVKVPPHLKASEDVQKWLDENYHAGIKEEV